jgi:hypothetical protein
MSDFNPPTAQCLDCLDLIRSSYSGEFVKCKCGNSFVDQTLYYSRYGGNIKPAKEGEETT